MADRIQGTVTRVMSMRGFGFIMGDDGVERFLHVDNLRSVDDWPGMKAGKRVVFGTIETPKGLRATEVAYAD